MTTLTIPDMPDAVIRQLSAQASQHHCTLEEEARMRLVSTVRKSPEEVRCILEKIRIHRESLSVPPPTEEFLREAKNWGRP